MTINWWVPFLHCQCSRLRQPLKNCRQHLRPRRHHLPNPPLPPGKTGAGVNKKHIRLSQKTQNVCPRMTAAIPSFRGCHSNTEHKLWQRTYTARTRNRTTELRAWDQGGRSSSEVSKLYRSLSHVKQNQKPLQTESNFCKDDGDVWKVSLKQQLQATHQKTWCLLPMFSTGITGCRQGLLLRAPRHT